MKLAASLFWRIVTMSAVIYLAYGSGYGHGVRDTEKYYEGDDHGIFSTAV